MEKSDNMPHLTTPAHRVGKHSFAPAKFVWCVSYPLVTIGKSCQRHDTAPELIKKRQRWCTTNDRSRIDQQLNYSVSTTTLHRPCLRTHHTSMPDTFASSEHYEWLGKRKLPPVCGGLRWSKIDFKHPHQSVASEAATSGSPLSRPYYSPSLNILS